MPLLSGIRVAAVGAALAGLVWTAAADDTEGAADRTSANGVKVPPGASVRAYQVC
ncbi:hypothetical protein [Urbifossiella limnaea]|uniref:Uncharacterized protein n=1 Tax=Urbifossiella limnaea TaxID=2528023 RepID=A0A517XV63_9BACT|nr:hypothetical protein [Urbifossiella limnaea]QDU21369.1 hypothetical protein ETAA1_33360 [Urbifossiella limnaea]